MTTLLSNERHYRCNAMFMFDGVQYYMGQIIAPKWSPYKIEDLTEMRRISPIYSDVEVVTDDAGRHFDTQAAADSVAAYEARESERNEAHEVPAEVVPATAPEVPETPEGNTGNENHDEGDTGNSAATEAVVPPEVVPEKKAAPKAPAKKAAKKATTPASKSTRPTAKR